MMLTRCPACQTVFRLRPEQLHARGGEVRCGHCFQPFNALDHAVAPSAAAEAPPGTAPASSASSSTPAAASAADGPRSPRPPPASALDFEIPDFPLLEREPAPVTPGDSLWAPPPDGRAASAPTAPAMPGVVRSGRRRPPADDAIATAHTASSLPAAPTAVANATQAPRAEAAAPAKPADPTAPPGDSAAPPLKADTEHAPAHVAPAHVDLARLDATYGRPPRPARRMLAGLAVVVLASTLIAQGVYLFRMEIARALPELRPLLVSACAALGCEVPLPRDTAFIAIDASDLQSEPARPGRYLLHATINNRAPHAQAWPHLELTLTDASDAPIARRVLAPAEWAADADTSAPLPARQLVTVRLPFDAPELAPTGYRIYVFYP